MKNGFMRGVALCLIVVPFLALADGTTPAPASTDSTNVVTKAAETAVNNRGKISSALHAVSDFCKSHPYLIGATMLCVGVGAVVGYDLYKTAQEEEVEIEA